MDADGLCESKRAGPALLARTRRGGSEVGCQRGRERCGKRADRVQHRDAPLSFCLGWYIGANELQGVWGFGGLGVWGFVQMSVWVLPI